MSEECMICGAALEYLEQDAPVECAICHKKENSKARCINGHYVCDECHSQGVGQIIGECLKETSANPIEIMDRLMNMEFCHMHGPEHHIMVGSALLTAYKNAGGDLDLEPALLEMQRRGREVPGGICGFWGTCGAGVSSGIFVSILTKSTPLAQEEWGLSNLMTAHALQKIGEVGGPRCCKRDSYLAILAAIEFAEEKLGVKMERQNVSCAHFKENNQCIGTRCPFREAK